MESRDQRRERGPSGPDSEGALEHSAVVEHSQHDMNDVIRSKVEFSREDT